LKDLLLDSLIYTTTLEVAGDGIDARRTGGREDSNSKRIYDKEQSHFMTACDYSFAPAD